MLSDLSLKRPVFGTVLALLTIAFGLVCFSQLTLREFPNVDPPVVSIETRYPGAAAAVVESRITQLIEDRVAGLEGIEFIQSVSTDQRSVVTLEFALGRDIDAAANDVRDRVSRVYAALPDEADLPVIAKVDSNDDVILWMNFTSDRADLTELTDFANRVLVDRFSVLDGVARVQIGGGRDYAMRIWLDRNELAARGLTVTDVEAALRADNVELPAGQVESKETIFTVRLERSFRNEKDFRELVIGRGRDGYLVRLADVARVERGTVEERSLFRANGVPMIGVGIVKQSTANTVDVVKAARAEAERLNETLPEGMKLIPGFDASVFVEGAIHEVYVTLFIAIGLVVLVIFLFLGQWRATLVPAVAVPISIIGTFILLLVFGFSLNLLTLLGLVMAIGLVVDDAIVVLENIARRISTYGESPLVAAQRGTRQVFFAVVATTLVLVAVFVPIIFMGGTAGRLFTEFALTMAAAVILSSFVALSQSPLLASFILKPQTQHGWTAQLSDRVLNWMSNVYEASLKAVLKFGWVVGIGVLALGGSTWWLFQSLPSEYTPREDRGTFFVVIQGPEGATYDYIERYMAEIEDRLMPYVDAGEVNRLQLRAPGGFGTTGVFNSGRAIVVLRDWSQRRSAWVIMSEITQKLSDLPGVRVSTVMRAGFGARVSRPVQFVIGGGTYEELAQWRNIVLDRINANNPGLVGVDFDYKETKPQLEVRIDYDRAAALGVSVTAIGRTLETMLGGRRVTTYLDQGEEYDVIVEGERDEQRTAASLNHLYVRSATTGELIPLANLVTLDEFADPNELARYNRIRSITLEAGLSDKLSLGEALTYLQDLVRQELPPTAIIDYKGQSRDYQRAGSSIGFVFVLGLVVVFLVLAAQFESWLHPLVIMLTVPLAVFGGLLGLKLFGSSLNLYSQIGLILLIGLATKNGILIVEFANQLRDLGRSIPEAIVEASRTRLRPILMTGLTTAAGAVPLVIGSGPGAESRQVLGIVVLFGITSASLFTIYTVPVFYRWLAPFTRSPEARTRQLECESAAVPDRDGGEAPAEKPQP